MSIRILQGTVFDTLPQIPPGSVDCVVTSPPYWMLRSYLPKGHPLKPLELGSEPTPAAYVESMVRVFRLVRTAMADHAVCWLNIGDTYAGGVCGGGSPLDARTDGKSNKRNPTRESVRECRESTKQSSGLESGSLCLIPQRLAIALSDDGWIVRSVVVWHKPAPMPASVAGWRWARCRVKVKASKHGGGNGNQRMMEQGSKGHGITEDWLAQWQDCPGCSKCEPHGGYVLRRGSWRPTSAWEPILMLAKGAGYFSDGEAVKQPPSAATVARNLCDAPCQNGGREGSGKPLTGNQAPGGDMRPDDPYAAANLRDVWTIAAEPLKEKHYAAFPSELVLRCLRSGTSARGYCPACGAPWCRVVETKFNPQPCSPEARIRGNGSQKSMDESNGWEGIPRGTTEAKTLGWKQSCQCPEQEPRPGVVLDPFCGSGRTGLVARQLGLDFVGCELNPAYVEMAKRLLVESSPLFNQVEA